MALVSWRPCTLEDVARGLGTRPAEALRQLERLRASGILEKVAISARGFYVVVDRTECGALV